MISVLSIAVNVLYFYGKKKYIAVLTEIRNKRIPFFYHVIVYLFILWGLGGYVFMGVLRILYN